MNTIAQSIIEAAESVAQSVMSRANFAGATVMTVTKVIDPSIGKYTVNESGADHIAFAINNEKYKSNSQVYVLKTGITDQDSYFILGATEEYRKEDIQTEDEELYDQIGQYVVTNHPAPYIYSDFIQKNEDGTIVGEGEILLYHFKDDGDGEKEQGEIDPNYIGDINDISSENQASLSSYLKLSDIFEISTLLKANFEKYTKDNSAWSNAKYELDIIFAFNDGSKDDNDHYKYTKQAFVMSNPSDFITTGEVYQQWNQIFTNIKMAQNFHHIQQIALVYSGFPTEKEEYGDNDKIEIANFNLRVLKEKTSSDEMRIECFTRDNNGQMSFVGSEGENGQTLTIEAWLFNKDNERLSDNVTYSWYQRKINESDIWEWVSDNSYFYIINSKKDTNNEENHYKVVITYNGEEYEKEFIVYDYINSSLIQIIINDERVGNNQVELIPNVQVYTNGILGELTESTSDGIWYEQKYDGSIEVKTENNSKSDRIRVNKAEITQTSTYYYVKDDLIGSIQITTDNIGLRDWEELYINWGSSTIAPPDNATWESEMPSAQDDLYIWKKTIKYFYDGTTETIKECLTSAQGRSAYTLSLDNDSDIIARSNTKEIVSQMPVTVNLSRKYGGYDSDVGTLKLTKFSINGSAETDIKKLPGWISLIRDENNNISSFQIVETKESVKIIPDDLTTVLLEFTWTKEKILSNSETGEPTKETQEIILDRKYFSLNVVTSEVDYDLILDKDIINTSISGGTVTFKVRQNDKNGTRFLTKAEVSKVQISYSDGELALANKDTDANNSIAIWQYEAPIGASDPITFTLKIKGQGTSNTEEWITWDSETLEFIKDGGTYGIQFTNDGDRVPAYADGTLASNSVLDGTKNIISVLYNNEKQKIKNGTNIYLTCEVKHSSNNTALIKGTDYTFTISDYEAEFKLLKFPKEWGDVVTATFTFTNAEIGANELQRNFVITKDRSSLVDYWLDIGSDTINTASGPHTLTIRGKKQVGESPEDLTFTADNNNYIYILEKRANGTYPDPDPTKKYGLPYKVEPAIDQGYEGEKKVILYYNGKEWDTEYISFYCSNRTLSLSNDYDTIVRDNTGTIISSTPSTTITAFLGNTPITLKTGTGGNLQITAPNGWSNTGTSPQYSWSAGTATLTVNLNNIPVNFTGGSFKFTWTQNGITTSKDFTLNLISSEKDYDLIIDKTLINSSTGDGTYSISVLEKSATGTKTYISPSSPAGLDATIAAVYQGNTKITSWKNISYDKNTATPITYTLEGKINNSDVKWDEETVEFVKNGVNGTNGTNGIDAIDFNVHATAYVFKKDQDGNIDPKGGITFTAEVDGITGGVINWYLDNGSTPVQQNTSSYILTPGNFGSASKKIVTAKLIGGKNSKGEAIGDKTDSIEILAVQDGVDSFIFQQSNGSMTFTEGIAATENSTIMIYRGSTLIEYGRGNVDANNLYYIIEKNNSTDNSYTISSTTVNSYTCGLIQVKWDKSYTKNTVLNPSFKITVKKKDQDSQQNDTTLVLNHPMQISCGVSPIGPSGSPGQKGPVDSIISLYWGTNTFQKKSLAAPTEPDGPVKLVDGTTINNAKWTINIPTLGDGKNNTYLYIYRSQGTKTDTYNTDNETVKSTTYNNFTTPVLYQAYNDNSAISPENYATFMQVTNGGQQGLFYKDVEVGTDTDGDGTIEDSESIKETRLFINASMIQAGAFQVKSDDGEVIFSAAFDENKEDNKGSVQIGGWEVKEDNLSRSTVVDNEKTLSTGLSTQVGKPFIWAGILTDNTYPFQVSETGETTVSNLKITGSIAEIPGLLEPFKETRSSGTISIDGFKIPDPLAFKMADLAVYKVDKVFLGGSTNSYANNFNYLDVYKEDSVLFLQNVYAGAGIQIGTPKYRYITASLSFINIICRSKTKEYIILDPRNNRGVNQYTLTIGLKTADNNVISSASFTLYYKVGTNEIKTTELTFSNSSLSSTITITTINDEDCQFGTSSINLSAQKKISSINTDDVIFYRADSYSSSGEEQIENTDRDVVYITGDLQPAGNGNYYLGGPATRWNTVYAVNSTINTSDKNMKNSIKPLLFEERYSQIFDKLCPVIFKFNKNESDRYHIGLIAQDVEEALQEVGVDSKDFAVLCYEINENGEKENYGIRYGELIPLNILQIQKLKRRQALLEGALESLISGNTEAAASALKELKEGEVT